MKAAYIENIGAPENIKYAELPEPKPGDNDVVVELIATAVDPIDTYIRSGKYPIDLPKPFIVGRDLVGSVVKTGRAVSKFKLGDLVWSNNQGYDGRQGSCAEYLSVREDLLYALPSGVNPMDAIGVFHSALTAVTGLFWKARIQAGQTIFINGGSGNVGSAVVQLAKAAGARVAVTAGSKEKRDWSISCGADLVVDYRTDDIAVELKKFSPKGINIYWDASGKPDLEMALPVMAERGALILMASRQENVALPIGPFYRKNCTLYGFTITQLNSKELADGASIINDNLKKGHLKARVHEIMSLSRTAEAHKLVEESDLFGKILLVP